MASIYDLLPNRVFEVPVSDRQTTCRICMEFSQPDDGVLLGPLYQFGHMVDDPDGKNVMTVYCAHYFCLLFSCGLKTNGDDDEGIKGFLPEDMLQEWRRGQRLTCRFCSKKYATIGCSVASCRMMYHLPCGIRNGCQFQFEEPYCSYCPRHRAHQAVLGNVSDELVNTERECGACLEAITPIALQGGPEKDGLHSLHAPCCNKWYHRKCIQQTALMSGYFFKCPLCGNKDQFTSEMLRFGVFVPNQDAAWEEDENFDDLYHRHDRCDAEWCQCPEGREKDDDYTEWEVVLCRTCGSTGVHVACGGLHPSKDPILWRCAHCIEVLARFQPILQHRFTPISRNQKRPSASVKRQMQSLSFHLSDATVRVESKGFKTSIILTEHEVPMKVRLGRRPEASTRPVDSSPQVSPSSQPANAARVKQTTILDFFAKFQAGSKDN